MENYRKIFTTDVVKLREQEKHMFIDRLMEIIHAADTKRNDLDKTYYLISELKWPISIYPNMKKRLSEEMLLNIAYYIYAIENKILSKMEGYNNMVNLFLAEN